MKSKKILSTKTKVTAVLVGSISMYVLSSFFQILHFPFQFFFSLFAVILGGCLVGYILKQSGWVYGIIAALVLTFFIILINLVGFMTPREALLQTAGFNSVLKNLRFIPLNILFGGIGGFLGQKLSQNLTKNNK